MSELANLELARHIYAAYGRGDAGPMVAALDDDCMFYSMQPSRHVRFGAAYRGKAGFIQALADIAAEWELVAYRPTQLLSDGDWVIALCDVAFRHRATGALLEIDKVDTWRVRDGRIVHFKEYFDTRQADETVAKVMKGRPKAKAGAKRVKPKPAKRTASKRATPKKAKRAASKSSKPRAKRRRR